MSEEEPSTSIHSTLQDMQKLVVLKWFVAQYALNLLILQQKSPQDPWQYVILVSCIATGLGWVVGLFVPSCYRGLGVIPVAATGIFLVLGPPLAFGWPLRLWIGWLPFWLFGVGLGSAFVYSQLRFRYSRSHPTGKRFRAQILHDSIPFSAFTIGTVLGFLALSVYKLTSPAPLPDHLFLVVRWYLFVITAALCVWCWLRLFRPFFELCCEFVFTVLYAIRVKGPGVERVPPFGPVLVIANHASWFDPLFLAKFIPRPVTPMMTESFYKVWFIRPILQHVFRVIVVAEKAHRREAPELREAIEALGRGECVVLFPEGFLRRKEDVELRRFAQGVWHILTARPETPVVACWIEGSWGSKFSWRGGPPGAKAKRTDFRRRIQVGVSGPEVVPSEVLADQMATRIHLMNRVSGARRHVGLNPLPEYELPRADANEHQIAQTE